MSLSDGVWPDSLPAVEVRFARPTDKLDEVVAFYTELLGLPELYRTRDHGYEVVMVGLPGDRYHLEFTSHRDGSPGAAPTERDPHRDRGNPAKSAHPASPASEATTQENLLVFYFATEVTMFEVVERFGDAGHEPVELDNPWWRENGALAFSDPDGWRVVLMPKPVPLVA